MSGKILWIVNSNKCLAIVSFSKISKAMREIDKTIGGIDDPEMKDYLAQQQKEIEEKYAKLEAERLAALEREERARLERALEPYGR